MTERIYPSFNSANWLIDYVAKKVQVDYPEKPTFAGNWWYLSLVAGIGVLGGVLFFGVLSTFLPFSAMIYCIWGILASPVVLILWEIKYQKFRKWKIHWEKPDEHSLFARTDPPCKGKQLVLSNVGNYLTKYHLSGNCGAYLQSVEMRCIKKERDDDDVYYTWLLIFRFKKHPITGAIFVRNWANWDDRVKGRKGPQVYTGRIPRKVVAT